jgi:hypothetical protein
MIILLLCVQCYIAVSNKTQGSQALLREVKPTKPSTHFHLHVNVNIAFPVGGLSAAFIITILVWCYKIYTNRRNGRLTGGGTTNEEPGIELITQEADGDTN